MQCRQGLDSARAPDFPSRTTNTFILSGLFFQWLIFARASISACLDGMAELRGVLAQLIPCAIFPLPIQPVFSGTGDDAIVPEGKAVVSVDRVQPLRNLVAQVAHIISFFG